MDELREVLELCYNSVGTFGKTFFPETFCTPFVELHNQMIQALDSRHQKIVIAAPRNIGKTSLATALIIKGILYRDYEFILYVSQSLESHALAGISTSTTQCLRSSPIKPIIASARG